MHQLAVHREAAFSVQFFAFFERALGRGAHIAQPLSRRTSRLLAHGNAGHGNAELQANQVIGLVHRSVFA